MIKATFLNPDKVLSEIKIKKNAQIGDFGCGAGAWTISAALVLEGKGKIYALDILDHMLEVVESKRKRHNLKNIKTIKTDLERPLSEKIIKKNSLDLAIVSNILFQIKNKKKFIENIKNSLKKNGQALVIDWDKDAFWGPEEQLRLDKKEVEKLFKNYNFVFKKELDAGHFHYGLLFQLK